MANNKDFLPEQKFHSLSEKETLEQLDASGNGLTSHQAELRLHHYGLNELKARKGLNSLKIFLQQFSSPLIWILLVAVAISLAFQEDIDAVVISVIIVINAFLGFIQEYKAGKAIEALQKLAALKAKVLRNGRVVKIDSCYLVPGDVLILETGDKVAADARLLEIHSLHTEEGPLTGESQPVTKFLEKLPAETALADRKNMVYASTIVSRGAGRAVVVSTGMNSEVGKIASLIEEAEDEPTPLQKKVWQLGKYLTTAAIIVALVIFAVGTFSGQPASVMFLTAIALAVAAIPEGLPAVITISLGMSVQKMARRNALVRRLPAVEALGSVDVICTDKTGTLTHNQMTVTRIYANNRTYELTGSGYRPEGAFLFNNQLANPLPLHQLLRCGALCNSARFGEKKVKEEIVREVIGDPTEAALLVSAEKAGLSQGMLHHHFPKEGEIPFSSERKMMTTIHTIENTVDAHEGKMMPGRISFTKGAPDIIINLCNRILIDGKVHHLDQMKREEILRQNEHFARQALRVLGLAYNDRWEEKKGAEKHQEAERHHQAERGMIFLGLQAMIDPPRMEVKESIRKCREAGIRVIMITGDHINTAKAIADQLGITGKAITGQEMEKISLEKEIGQLGIFARVSPEHKLQIVRALKKKGHIVAVTGDGVNDAPALKKADIGVAMGITGTDVAKEAADMILTDDNFTSIVNAIEEGRGIFDNIRKFVNYLLSSNLGEISTILLASLFRLPLPLTAIQILWINLVTDGLPATALSVDPASSGIMKRKPRPSQESILPRGLRRDIILFGFLIGLGCLALFWLYQGAGLAKARTVTFTALIFFEIVRLQVIRAGYKLKVLSNRWLLGAIIFSLLLHLSIIYTPLNRWFGTTPLALIDWGFILLGGLVLWGVYQGISWAAMRGKKGESKFLQKLIS